MVFHPLMVLAGEHEGLFRNLVRDHPTLQKAMVRIKIDTGSGSGMVISSDGYILTANHVLEGTKEIKIVPPDNKELPGKTLGRDEIRDMVFTPLF